MELLKMERGLENVVLSLSYIFLYSVILCFGMRERYNKAWAYTNSTYVRTKSWAILDIGNLNATVS